MSEPTINPDLAETLRLMDGHADSVAAQSRDDQRQQKVIDSLAKLNGVAFVSLAELAEDMVSTSLRNKAEADFYLGHLAVIGWGVVLESLTERVREQQESAA